MYKRWSICTGPREDAPSHTHPPLPPLSLGVGQVLMETFERMSVSGEGRPVRLMILRALESMCNKAARHDDKRRPPEQERRAMGAVTR